MKSTETEVLTTD